MERNHIVQSLANTTMTTTATFNETCTLKKVAWLAMLFSWMQHLRIHISLHHTPSIFRLLLDTNKRIHVK
ncbi:hypothetical protein I4U23_005954 [Adineta vaga]|nr:hypothetical protein I4U23_005954 [Adineta vaga]